METNQRIIISPTSSTSESKNEEPTVTFESCLLCSSPTKANSFSNFELLPGCEGSQLLNQQMWSIFILRNLLQYPDQNFSSLMKETFGILNPSSWFDLCDNCAGTVKSAMEVHSKILELETDLSKLRIEVGKVMAMSLKRQTPRDRDALECLISPRERIREYYKDKNTKPETVILIPKEEDVNETYSELDIPVDFAISTEDTSNEGYTEDFNLEYEGKKKDFIFTAASNNVRPEKDRRMVRRRAPQKDDTTGAERGNLSPSNKTKNDDSVVIGSVDSYKKDGKYYCPLCPVSFTPRQSILRHLRDHRREKYVFKCKLCPFPAPTFQRLRLHVEKIHPRNNRDSEETEFTNAEDSLSTSENHHDQIKLQYADWMKRENPNDSDSSEEERINPKKGHNLTCKLCGRTFTNSDYFKRHNQLHVTNKHLQCPKCNYPAVNQSGLDKHLKYELCKKKCFKQFKIYNCDACKFVTKRRYKFEAHVSLHKAQISSSKNNNNIIKKVPRKPTPSSKDDQYCGKENNAVNLFTGHNENEDSLVIAPDTLDRYRKDGIYQCPLCPVTYGIRQSLIVHLRDHRRKKYVFKCKLCHFPAQTFQKLRLHMKRMHSCGKAKSEESEVTRAEDGLSKKESSVSENPRDTINFEDLDKIINENESSSESSEEEQMSSTKGHNIICAICGRKFTNSASFRRHEKLHTSSKHLECPKCRYPAVSQNALDKHIKHNWCYQNRSFRNILHKCDQCNFSTKKKYKFNAHVSVHKAQQLTSIAGEIIFPCKICNRTFLSEESFKMHVKSHESCKDYTCPKCNFPCANSTALKTHKERNKCHVDDFTKPDELFQCELCPFSTTSKGFSKQHMTNHKIYDGAETADGQWKCKLCEGNPIFSTKRKLMRHIRGAHESETGLSVFKCSLCPKFYADKTTLDDHFNQIHLHQSNFKYFCEFCGYGTSYQSNLTAHRAKHKEERPHVCEHCGTSYKHAAVLRNHMKKVHSGNRKTTTVNCKYCQKEFQNKGLLNLHFRDAHGDLYAHKCDKCDNAYMSVASLQLHKKINHSGNKAECQFCGATVTNRVYLYAHYNKCKEKPPDFKYTVPRGGGFQKISYKIILTNRT